MEHDSSDGRPPSDRVPSVWDVPGDFGDDTQWRAFDETEYEWEPFATQNPKPRRLLFIAATALFALASIAAGGGALWFLARDTEADDGPATEETSDPWITSSSALPTSALPSSALPTSAVPGAATGSTRRAEESARRPEPPEQPGERRGGVGGEVAPGPARSDRTAIAPRDRPSAVAPRPSRPAAPPPGRPPVEPRPAIPAPGPPAGGGEPSPQVTLDVPIPGVPKIVIPEAPENGADSPAAG